MGRTANLFRTAKSSNPSISQEDITSLVRKKAYELWEKRGRTPGHAIDDWLEAERIVGGRRR